MKYTCIACSEMTMGNFFGKEKALFYILNMKKEQKDVFLISFIDYEIIMKIMHYYKNTNFEIDSNIIYYKNYYMKINEYSIETNEIETNILFNYMKRMHRIWIIMDENGNVQWINACKVVENCVK